MRFSSNVGEHFLSCCMWRTLLKIRWKCDSPRNEHSFLSFLPPRVVLILLQKTREDLENVYFWVNALFNGSAWVRWWVFGGVVEMLGWGLTRQSHADSVSDALNAARSTRGKTADTARRRRDVGWDQIHTLLLTRLNQSPPTPPLSNRCKTTTSRVHRQTEVNSFRVSHGNGSQITSTDCCLSTLNI